MTQRPSPKGLLLDMDGVLFQGEKVLSEAIASMQSIHSIQHVFLTNNPTKLAKDVVIKMKRLGFPNVSDTQILTSGEAAAIWLSQQYKEFSFYAVRAKALA